MIPSIECDPYVNVINLGSLILKRLKSGAIGVNDLLVDMPKELGVSMDHVILTADWLYAINAIYKSGDKIFLNEVQKDGEEVFVYETN